jgi:hypothetical protein
MSLIRRISGDFRHLCKPAMVYLAISVVVLVSIAYQNMGRSNIYCMGDFSCYVPSTAAVIFSEALYILFWTWILHLMCRTGYASISWLLVVFPLVLFFVLIGLMMLASMNMTQSGRVKQMLPIERPARVREGFRRQAPRLSEVSQIDSQRRQPIVDGQRQAPRHPELSQRDLQRRQPQPMMLQQDLMQSDPVQVDPVQVDTMQSDAVVPAQLEGYIGFYDSL